MRDGILRDEWVTQNSGLLVRVVVPLAFRMDCVRCFCCVPWVGCSCAEHDVVRCCFFFEVFDTWVTCSASPSLNPAGVVAWCWHVCTDAVLLHCSHFQATSHAVAHVFVQKPGSPEIVTPRKWTAAEPQGLTETCINTQTPFRSLPLRFPSLLHSSILSRTSMNIAMFEKLPHTCAPGVDLEGSLYGRFRDLFGMVRGNYSSMGRTKADRWRLALESSRGKRRVETSPAVGVSAQGAVVGCCGCVSSTSRWQGVCCVVA